MSEGCGEKKQVAAAIVVVVVVVEVVSLSYQPWLF